MKHKMSGKGPYRNRYYGKKPKTTFGEKGKEILEQIDENSPVIKMFREYSTELDTKHDRYERIIKISRDITIESKRIIFLLHSSHTDLDTKRELILKEAALRLQLLLDKSFRPIALELKDLDSYQYLRAYTSGLQEYVEAVALYQFLRFGNVDSWGKLRANFKFSLAIPGQSTMKDADPEDYVELLFPAMEFILGLSDFTGELMRRCINNLGTGNIEDCFRICNIVKDIYTGCLGLNVANQRELRSKVYILKQSLLKMENVCYNIKVRGSEVPKHMLAEITIGNTEQNDESDEGFF